MSEIILNAHIVGQSVQMANLPLIASGIKGALQIQCTFSEEWSGYGKTAVFYRNAEEVYHALLTGNKVTVPTEVLTAEGSFFFGIMGTAGGLTLPTEVLRVNMVKGAITTATAEPAAPVPNIYEELLSAYGRMDSQLNELVAMRGNGGTEQTVSGDCFRGTIYSNGAAAFISIEFYDLPLAAGAERTDFCIMPAFAPLGQVTLNSAPNGPQAVVTITPRGWSGTDWAGITITNPTGEDLVEAVEFEGYYHLESIFIPELADVRVDAKGTVHQTAGEAVRDQTARPPAKLATVTLRASAWTGADGLYSQVVTINGITAHSKVDLLPSVEQLAIFFNKNVSFVTENEDGVVTVYAIGDKPTLDYTMQAQLTEVET